MFRNENETLAVAHLWAIEVPYEGVWSSMGLFTTEEQAQAVIDADDFLNGYAFAVPMALPTA